MLGEISAAHMRISHHGNKARKTFSLKYLPCLVPCARPAITLMYGSCWLPRRRRASTGGHRAQLDAVRGQAQPPGHCGAPGVVAVRAHAHGRPLLCAPNVKCEVWLLSLVNGAGWPCLVLFAGLGLSLSTELSICTWAVMHPGHLRTLAAAGPKP